MGSAGMFKITAYHLLWYGQCHLTWLSALSRLTHRQGTNFT